MVVANVQTLVAKVKKLMSEEDTYLGKLYSEKFETVIPTDVGQEIESKQQEVQISAQATESLWREINGFHQLVKKTNDPSKKAQFDSQLTKLKAHRASEQEAFQFYVDGLEELAESVVDRLEYAESVNSESDSNITIKKEEFDERTTSYRRSLAREGETLNLTVAGNEAKYASVLAPLNEMRQNIERRISDTAALFTLKIEQIANAKRVTKSQRDQLDAFRLSYESVLRRIKDMDTLFLATQNALGDLSKPKKNGRACDARSVTQNPYVRIFLLTPPPQFDLDRANTYLEVQQFVDANYGRFRWPPSQGVAGFNCGLADGVLNSAQYLCYHYMNPNNLNVNILLAHSAGSGKTATMMLINSVFMRAGYHSLLVTKNELKAGKDNDNGYFSAAFEQGADFNVQNCLQMNGVPSVRALCAAETGKPVSAITKKEVLDRGIQIWRDMGLCHDILSYQQFSNDAEGFLKGVVSTRMEKYQRGSPVKGDPMAMKIVIVDEAHKLTAHSTEMKTGGSGDVLAIQELFWKSRELSGPKSVRVVLATATPVADSVVDAVVLGNLLVPRKKALVLDYSKDHEHTKKGNVIAQSKWFKTKKEMEESFATKFDRSHQQLEQSIRKLFKGTVSFLNLVGDNSIFAVKDVEYFDGTDGTVDVTLSDSQRESIKLCAKENTSLKFNGYSWEDDTVEPSSDNNPVKFRECVAMSVNFPKVKGSLDFLRTLANGTTWKEWEGLSKARQNEELSTYVYERSPIITSLLERIQQFKAANPSLKQFVYSDLAKQDIYGVDLVAALLERLYGYVSYTKPAGSEKIRVLKDAKELAAIPKYMGMLVLNKKSRDNAEEFLRIFNSSDNADGSKISIVLFDGNFKEGKDLYDIGAVHVIGYVDSQADLTQAVARAFRNCRSTRVPWVRNRGAIVKVFIYSPSLGDGAPSIRDLIAQVLKNDDELIQGMNYILQDVAFDKTLLSEINTKSFKEESKIRLENPDSRR